MKYNHIKINKINIIKNNLNLEIMNKVILTAKDGQIFKQSLNADGTPKLDKNGKPFGYVRVENQGTLDFSYAYNNGGVRRGQSALIAMTVEAWEKAKNFYKEGMEIPGRVVVLESLTQEAGSKPKMAGSGADAQPCTFDGQQIYRRTEFDAKGVKEDVLIAHNNEIKASVSSEASVEKING
jgi:hypothetical protein